MSNELDDGSFKGTARFGHLILFATVIFVIVAITWANYAKLDEVTHAEGKIIPSRHVQVIQNLEGGIVKQILVREGQHVKKGEILMYLDDTQFSSDYKEKNLEELALRGKVVRLAALVDKAAISFPAGFSKKAPAVVKQETALFNSKKREMKALKDRLSFIDREINMTRPLIKDGAVSQVELLRLEQSRSEIDGEINAMESAIINDLNEAKTDLSQASAALTNLKYRLERTSVRSPVHGIVKQIHIATVGGVIKPGMDLMEIVPVGDTLLVEGKVKPSRIGFIHPGQKAMVKITAYDFTIYGGLVGIVEHISADATKDEDGESYYEIWVRTQKNYLGTPKEKLNIIPGMQATVDILTGKKTVMEYIMKPILRAKQRALTER